MGFLGLNLSGDMANDLLEEIKLAGIHGFVVPAAYRHPKITRDMAQAIAFEALEKEQKTRFPTVTFEPLQYVNENAMWWKFGAASPEWIERGWHVDGRKKPLSQLAQGSKNVIAAPTVRHPPKAKRAFIRAGL